MKVGLFRDWDFGILEMLWDRFWKWTPFHYNVLGEVLVILFHSDMDVTIYSANCQIVCMKYVA